MKRKIRVTESELISSIERIVKEQTATLGFGNTTGFNNLGMGLPTNKHRELGETGTNYNMTMDKTFTSQDGSDDEDSWMSEEEEMEMYEGKPKPKGWGRPNPSPHYPSFLEEDCLDEDCGGSYDEEFDEVYDGGRHKGGNPIWPPTDDDGPNKGGNPIWPPTDDDGPKDVWYENEDLEEDCLDEDCGGSHDEELDENWWALWHTHPHKAKFEPKFPTWESKRSRPTVGGNIADLVRNELLETQAKEAKKWIKGAVKRPGALRKKLGVVMGWVFPNLLV